jgi:hypothetical protein
MCHSDTLRVRQHGFATPAAVCLREVNVITLAHALEPSQVCLLQGVHGDERALSARPCQLCKAPCALNQARETAAHAHISDISDERKERQMRFQPGWLEVLNTPSIKAIGPLNYIERKAWHISRER